MKNPTFDISSSSPSSSSPSLFQQTQMAVKDLVEKGVAENRVIIFSKSYCPYCRRAKALFKSAFPDVQVKVHELDMMEDGAAIQDYLEEQTGQRSVPNIFINGQHIGGSDTVDSLHKKGKLAALVNASAA